MNFDKRNVMYILLISCISLNCAMNGASRPQQQQPQTQEQKREQQRQRKLEQRKLEQQQLEQQQLTLQLRQQLQLMQLRMQQQPQLLQSLQLQQQPQAHHDIIQEQSLIQQRDVAEHKNLWQAAKDGDYDLVDQYIAQQHVDLNAYDNQGLTPLLYAIRNKHNSIVHALIEAKVNTDIPDKRFGCSPLHHAAEAGNDLIAFELIARSAQSNIINLTDPNGNTPLHFACFNGHEKVVELLLCYGADTYAQNKYSQTPLNYAIQGKHDAVVTALKNATFIIEAQKQAGPQT